MVEKSAGPHPEGVVIMLKTSDFLITTFAFWQTLIDFWLHAGRVAPQGHVLFDTNDPQEAQVFAFWPAERKCAAAPPSTMNR